MMRIYKNNIWRYVHIFLGIAAVLATFYLATKVSVVGAYNYSWAKSYITVSNKDSNEIPPTKRCNDKDLIVSGVHGDYRTYCYYDHESWGYADTAASHIGKYAVATNGYDVALRFQGVRLGSWYDSVDLYDLPGTDNLLVLNDGQNELDQPSTRIVSNVDSRFEIVDMGYSYTPRYVMILDTDDPVFSIENTYGGETPTAKSVAISESGDWLVLALGSMGQWSSDAYGFGLVRVNLRTYETKRFASIDAAYVNDTSLAITNDGESVAIALGSDMTFYDVENDCGDGLIVQTNEHPISNECPSTHRRSIISKYSKISELDFLDDKTLLLLDSHSGKRAELSIGGGSASDHLEYLAMGDSYSSGEGDIGNGNHYLGGTEGKDLCHVSNRSYPFILRDYYGISRANMKSVACSGAQVVFDYLGNDVNYNGQGHRLGNMKLSDVQIKDRQQLALENFVPGETKQINFVKEYKPRVVSFTGGGNDVGFGRVLEYCGRSLLVCGYAIGGSELNGMLYDSINSQYQYSKMFIDEIKETSPNTRIVLIGYPSFVAGADAHCGFLEQGLLDKAEREMINQAVGYMNSTLKSLATREGISYVDVEDSLKGGRVCEPGGYVNSVTDVGISNITKNHDQSVFHPNHLGHEKIARAIIDEDVILEPNADVDGSYFIPPIPETITLPQYFVKTAGVTLGNAIKIVTSPGIFLMNSIAKGILHSDPIDLGEFTVNEDGSLSGSIPTDNLPPGPHVLVFEGTGPGGKPVKYYQHIFIEDPDEIEDNAGSDAETKKSNQKISEDKKELIEGDDGKTSGVDSRLGKVNEPEGLDESGKTIINDDNSVGKDYQKEAVNNLVKKVFNPFVLLIGSVCIIVTIIGIIYAKHKRRS